MIKVALAPSALARVRLSYSPMWEATQSLRLLVHQPAAGRHRDWLRWARPRVDPENIRLLSHLLPTPHHYPDFLTPPPGRRPRSFSAELASLADMDRRRAIEELEATSEGPVPPQVRRVLDRADGMRTIAGWLADYWESAVAPVWPKLRHVLTADLAARADELAADGLHALLNRLHPLVAFNGQELLIDMFRHDVTRAASTVDDLALVPCVFGWPEMLVVVTEPYPVAVSYGPRGAGALWHPQSKKSVEPLADLMGRSRAAILALLDVPVSSSQIAEQANLSLASVTQHLAVLRGAGLVSTRKAGRTAWSVRSDLGTSLLEGGPAEA